VRIVRIAIGIVLVLIGVAGWVLPLVPGWPFVIWGLSMLAREIHWVDRQLTRIRNYCARRFPRLYWAVETLHGYGIRAWEKIKRLLLRVFGGVYEKS